jgi:hypothetical protein
MTRRQALVTLAWIAAFVVVGAGLAGVIVGRAAMDGLRSTSDPGS